MCIESQYKFEKDPVKQSATNYDVALSFAGEDRQYVEAVAVRLQAEGVRVFYDRYEQVALWGKDLYQHLSEVYQNQARFTVLFVSKHYASKLWPRHELKAAQARAFRENEEYLLPARFDATEIPGLLPTVVYMDLQQMTPDELAAAICKKIVQGGGKIFSQPGGPVVTGAKKTSPQYTEPKAFLLSKRFVRTAACLDYSDSLTRFRLGMHQVLNRKLLLVAV